MDKYDYINRIHSLLYDFTTKDLQAIYEALWNLSERSMKDGYQTKKGSNHRDDKSS